MRSLSVLSIFLAFSITGSVSGQTEYASNLAFSNIESDLRADRAARLKAAPESRSKLDVAIRDVLREARWGKKLSWELERHFWEAALTTLFDEKSSKSIRAKRDSLLSGLTPPDVQLYPHEWEELAARLECFTAAKESVGELQILFGAGLATADLCLAEISYLTSEALSFHQCLMTRLPCSDTAIRDELLCELKLKYVKAECAAIYNIWSTYKTSSSDRVGNKYGEASARARLYRSLADLEKLRLEQKVLNGDIAKLSLPANPYEALPPVIWRLYRANSKRPISVNVESPTVFVYQGVRCRLLGVTVPEESHDAAVAFVKKWIGDSENAKPLTFRNLFSPLVEPDETCVVWACRWQGTLRCLNIDLVAAGHAEVDYSAHADYRFTLPSKGDTVLACWQEALDLAYEKRGTGIDSSEIDW